MDICIYILFFETTQEATGHGSYIEEDSSRSDSLQLHCHRSSCSVSHVRLVSLVSLVICVVLGVGAGKGSVCTYAGAMHT